MNRIWPALFIGSIFFFISCGKPDNGQTTLRPIKEIMSQAGDSIGYSFFTYNSRNWLISEYDSNNNNNLYKITINYDTSGIPVSCEIFNNNNIRGRLESQEIDSFIYNSNNQVIQKVNKANPDQNETFTYDASGRLIADTDNLFIYDENNDAVTGYYSYTYTANNITATYNDTFNVSYNSTINPYRSLFPGNLGYIIFSPYGYETFATFLSKHNLTRMVANGVVSTYQYEYNADGTLSRSIVTYPGYLYNNSCTTSYFY